MMIFILECLPVIAELARTAECPFIFGISDRRRFERLG
jgi:hypothetical protein